MDTFSDQPAHARNKAIIRSILESGCSGTSKRLGIELEHILVDNTGDPLSYATPTPPSTAAICWAWRAPA